MGLFLTPEASLIKQNHLFPFTHLYYSDSTFLEKYEGYRAKVKKTLV